MTEGDFIGIFEREDNGTQYHFMVSCEVLITPVNGPEHKLKFKVDPPKGNQVFDRLIIGDKSFIVQVFDPKYFVLATSKGSVTFVKR